MADEIDTVDDEQTTDEQTGEPDEVETDDGDTFPADVVRKLRKESAAYRERARTAEARVDELSRALFTARVEATGKLASADDLPFDAALLDEPDALDAAVDELIAKRPHYAKRKVAGNIGQGVHGEKSGPVDFSGLLTH